MKTLEFKPRKVNGHNFNFTECAVEISHKNMFRFSIASTNDSYFCFAEERTVGAKKITIVLGGWGNANSTVNWVKDDCPPRNDWYADQNSELGKKYGWREAVCHSGPNKPDWYEVEWNIKGLDGPSMRISRIKDENGGGKKVKSTFPLRETKINWFMMACGGNPEGKYKVII